MRLGSLAEIRRLRDRHHIDRDRKDLRSRSSTTPESPGRPLERAMTIATFRFEPSIRIALTAAGIPTVKLSTNVAAPTTPRKDGDWEERRWQLEWDRRNIED